MQFQFYNHPLIDLMVNKPWIKKYELFRDSGICDRRIFNAEYRKLIKEGHFVESFGRYSLTTLSLYVAMKEGGYFFDRIPIKYIPQDELQSLLGFKRSGNRHEDSFGFILFVKYIQLKEEDKTYFERSNNILLNMEHYNYFLSAEYIDYPYSVEEAIRPKHINIVLLCDNPLFTDELSRGLKEIYSDDVTLYNFSGSNETLDFLHEKFTKYEVLNLVIADMGMDATRTNKFIDSVRELEIACNNFPLPLITISGLDGNNEFFDNGFVILPKSCTMGLVNKIKLNLLNHGKTNTAQIQRRI